MDSYGTLEPQGITGLNYVQITAGTPSKQLLKDGEDAVNELWDSRDTLAPWSLEAWGKSLGGTPELRLQNWLDNYSERGSFDDRTLVVMKFDDE